MHWNLLVVQNTVYERLQLCPPMRLHFLPDLQDSTFYLAARKYFSNLYLNYRPLAHDVTRR
jgi:hypothetical protein